MKTALRILILLLVLLVVIPATFITLLTTSYANPTWKILSEHINLPFQAEQVSYDFPYHVTLEGVSIKQQQIPYVEKVDVWLNPDIRHDGKWIVDSLLIDGVNIQYETLAQMNVDGIQFHQIALKNIDVASRDFSVHGLNLQIQSPNWSTTPSILPYGEIQLSAKQIYWNGETFNQALIDLNYQPQDSTLYGASFRWRNSQVSGQAEQYPQGWSLVNVTLDKLKLSNEQLQSLLAKSWQTLPIKINHLNSLDLLNADIAWGDWHWQNLALSIEDADLPVSLWQTRAQVSLQADSVRFQQQTAIEPRLSAVLSPGQVQLKELSLDWHQGRVQLSGLFQPRQWQLDTVSVQGLKWAMKPEDGAGWWHAITHTLNQITVNDLDIERSQIIQLSTEPYWQLSGLNLEGSQLNLKRPGQYWSIWDGNLEASVVNASYDQVLSSHAAFTSQSDNGLWELTRLFAPLDQGYIEGFGQIDLSLPSKPWSLNLNADGVPLKLVHPYLPDTLKVEGLSDLSVNLQGLAGDYNMLAYSLTGDVEANLRDTSLPSQPDSTLNAVTFSPIRLQAQRGAVSSQPVTISGKTIRGKITGAFDMANNPLSGLTYQLIQHCGQIKGDLFTNAPTRNDCIAEKTNQTSGSLEEPNVAPTDLQPAPDSQKQGQENILPPTPMNTIKIEQQEEEREEEIIEEAEPTINEETPEQPFATEQPLATE
ncbi:AsmA family protein [Vibrio mytili]|uniref:AsmA family protein n=1 Tax=Vibrio mytili TaxID=50718 RepID=UPI003C6F6AE4